MKNINSLLSKYVRLNYSNLIKQDWLLLRIILISKALHYDTIFIGKRRLCQDMYLLVLEGETSWKLLYSKNSALKAYKDRIGSDHKRTMIDKTKSNRIESS